MEKKRNQTSCAIRRWHPSIDSNNNNNKQSNIIIIIIVIVIVILFLLRFSVLNMLNCTEQYK